MRRTKCRLSGTKLNSYVRINAYVFTLWTQLRAQNLENIHNKFRIIEGIHSINAFHAINLPFPLHFAGNQRKVSIIIFLPCVLLCEVCLLSVCVVVLTVNSLQQDPSWEANNLSATHEIQCLLWVLKMATTIMYVFLPCYLHVRPTLDINYSETPRVDNT